MKVNVRDFGAVADGITDDTQAFLNAIDAVSSGSFTFYPGLTWYGGGTIEVPASNKPYIVSQKLKLRSRTILKGEGFDSVLLWKGPTSNSGLVLDSFFINSQQDVRVENLGLHSMSGGIGYHLQGGVEAKVNNCHFGGWDDCIVMEVSILTDISNCSFSSQTGIGNPSPNGIKFAQKSGSAGGQTNINHVRNCSFNACNIGITHEDGVGNVVEGCSFYAPYEMIRLLGAGDFTVRECHGEGFRGSTVIRGGPPGGPASGGLVVWMRFAFRDCVLALKAWNPANPTPYFLFMELGCLAYGLDLGGTRILGGRPDGAGGDLGCISGDWPSPPGYTKYVNINGVYTPPFHYGGVSNLHTVYSGPGTRGLWHWPPYGVVP